jgi:hypothetical protein
MKTTKNMGVKQGTEKLLQPKKGMSDPLKTVTNVPTKESRYKEINSKLKAAAPLEKISHHKSMKQPRPASSRAGLFGSGASRSNTMNESSDLNPYGAGAAKNHGSGKYSISLSAFKKKTGSLQLDPIDEYGGTQNFNSARVHNKNAKTRNNNTETFDYGAYKSARGPDASKSRNKGLDMKS